MPQKIRRQPRRGRLPRSWPTYAIALAAAAVIAFAVSSIGSASSGSAATQRTATADRGVVQSTVSGTGSLEAIKQVELNFGTSGEVTAVDVEPGDHVKKGEVLARIDSSAAEASMAQAKAQLAEAEEALEGAEEAEESEEVSTSLDSGGETVLADYAVEGSATSTDPTEATSTPTAPAGTSDPAGSGGSGSQRAPESGQTEGQAPSGTTKPESEGKPEGEEPEGAVEEPTGAQQEGSQGGQSKSKVEAPATETEAPATEQAAPSSSAAPESSGGASAGAISVATAEARLREARLAVKSARQEIRETTLRAPMDGTVASVSGEVGETVSGEASGASSSSSSSSGSSSSNPLAALGGGSESSESSGSSAFVVLSQLGQMKMEVTFSEADITKLKVGQTATVTISALEETELAGKVVHVGLLPEEGEVVEYPATIRLTQSAKGVRAGMSASADVVVEQVDDAISVPSEAITALGPSKTVKVKESDGKEVERTVKTGLAGDETTQVVDGLKAGETVVLPELSAGSGNLSSLLGGGAGGAAGGLGGGGGFPTGFPSGGGGAGFGP